MFLAPDKRKPDVLWLKKLRIYFLLITKSLEVYGPRVGQEVNWQQLCNLLAFSPMVNILTHLHPRGYPQDYLLLLCHCLGVYSMTIQRLSLLLIPLTASAPLHSPFLIMLSLATLGFIRKKLFLSFFRFPLHMFWVVFSILIYPSIGFYQFSVLQKCNIYVAGWWHLFFLLPLWFILLVYIYYFREIIRRKEGKILPSFQFFKLTVCKHHLKVSPLT